MWGLVFTVFAVAGVIGFIYVVLGFRRFAFMKRIKNRKKTSWGLALAIPALILVLLLVWNVMNAVVIIIHWLVFWILCDLVAVIIRFFVRKIRKKTGKAAENGATLSENTENQNGDETEKKKEASNEHYKPYYAGAAAFIITVTYMLYGWFSAHNVVETDYRIETEKMLKGESLRVVLIADSHTGAIFDGDRLKEYAKEIEGVNPDIVILAGDMVDDGSTYENMVKSCEALGSIKSTYGSIYVFGNHDKRYFGNGYYTVEQIRESMAANGVTILEDEHVAFNDNKICVIGRQDANVASRKAPIMLEANMNNDGISDDAFIIVADHQPTDCDAESRMHFDLVVSGHTHGGQMFPIGEISKIFGMNDIIYGLEERNGTSFVVTSGIADWEIPFKMGCKSEYVVIDVIGTK